ncbi:MAG: hypothetical protein ABIK73_08075 [candidate division WOR-3 bacterium]
MVFDFKISLPTPKYKASPNGIIQWGEDNKYPLFITYLAANSPTHGGILNGKVLRLLEGVQIQQSNPIGDSIYDVVKKCIRDYELFNGFAVKVIKTNNAIAYEHVPFCNLRATTDGKWFVQNVADKKDKGVIYDDYFLSVADVTIAAFFDKGNPAMDYDGNVIDVYYPLPLYASGIPSIMTEIEINRFHLVEATSGFKGGAILALNNGKPKNEEEKLAIERYISETLKNRNNSAGILVFYSDGKDRAPEISMLNGNNLDTRYVSLKETVIEQILISHQITSPLLVGIKTAGQLGGANELDIAREIFHNDYILPRREQIRKWLAEIGISVTWNNSFSSAKREEEKEDIVLNLLLQYGRPKGSVKELAFTDDINKPLARQYQLENKDYILTTSQKAILSLLDSGEDITGVLRVLGKQMTTAEILDDIDTLIALKYLTKDYVPTSRGVKAMERGKVIKTYYEYRVRPEYGEPIISTTREFCKRLIKAGRIYTRAEIEEISRRANRDVWLYRGGFYHDPNANKTYPSCRHTWWQIIVEE